MERGGDFKGWRCCGDRKLGIAVFLWQEHLHYSCLPSATILTLPIENSTLPPCLNDLHVLVIVCYTL